MEELDEELDDFCVVCVTVQMGQWNPKTIVPDSIQTKCNNCSIEVYLSPQGQNIVNNKKDKAKILCMECTQKTIMNLSDEEFEQLKSDRLRSVADAAPFSDSDEILRKFRKPK